LCCFLGFGVFVFGYEGLVVCCCDLLFFSWYDAIALMHIFLSQNIITPAPTTLPTNPTTTRPKTNKTTTTTQHPNFCHQPKQLALSATTNPQHTKNAQTKKQVPPKPVGCCCVLFFCFAATSNIFGVLWLLFRFLIRYSYKPTFAFSSVTSFGGR
jgi:hypothetical protein